MQPTLPNQLQDIINRLNQVNNILVTVKANPTVDELSAALGLTMALNNYGKHATAVFSGQIPNAMSFLKPQKTFENNVHSLRDFIISLNKEKADKLRFAKDGEIVKIYITPYKSTITPTDLEYSEGDFNVEMVIAVGINVKEELDTVIAAHGRILHEATVATVMPGQSPSQLGSINWADPTVTSSSAMAVQLLQSLNMPNLLSPEVSTALLTGIVADTDRFSNSKTSPRIMELAAQLMNSGANHLLVTSSIAAEAHPVIPKNPSIPNAAPAPLVKPPVSQDAETNQELVLDLHAQNVPSPSESAPLPATNTSPMVSSTPTNPIEAQPAVQSSAPQPEEAKPQPTPTPEPIPKPSPAVAELLPRPADASQTVVPADLMPPQTPVSIPNTPVAQPTLDSTPVPVTQDSPDSGVEDIRSEIDKIYSAEPFDPANNPRQDVATNIALPEDTPPEKIEQDKPTISDSSNLFVDTSVQEAQANPTLKPIEATKDETLDASAILGDSPAHPNDSTELPSIPGLEMPPEITPPPPPPNPLLNTPKTSSIDNEPFGNSVNFDPTKPSSDAK